MFSNQVFFSMSPCTNILYQSIRREMKWKRQKSMHFSKGKLSNGETRQELFIYDESTEI